MRVIFTGKRVLLRAPVIISAALVIVLCFTLFFFFSSGDDSTALAEQHSPVMSDDVITNSEAVTVSALLGTLEYFGASDTDEALTIWAEGVASRNGIAQYSVMSDSLKEQYLEVAGTSNLIFPTTATRVDGWYVSEVLESEDSTSTVKLRFNLDGGDIETAAAELTLEQDGEYCVVSAVAVESALYEFTGIG